MPFYSIEKLGTRSNVDRIINKNESISSIESKKSQVKLSVKASTELKDM